MTRSAPFHFFIGSCLAFTLGGTLMIGYIWYRSFSPEITIVGPRPLVPQADTVPSDPPEVKSELELLADIDAESSQLRSVLLAREELCKLNKRFDSLLMANIDQVARDNGDLTQEDYDTFSRLCHRLKTILDSLVHDDPGITKDIDTRLQHLSEAVNDLQKYTKLVEAPPYQQWHRLYDHARRNFEAVLAIIDPLYSQPARTLAQRIDDDSVLRELNVSTEYATFPDWLRPDRQYVKLSDDPEFDAKMEAWLPVVRKYRLNERHMHAGLALGIDPADIPAIVNGSEFKYAGLDLGAWLLERCEKEKGFTPPTIGEPVYINRRDTPTQRQLGEAGVASPARPTSPAHPIPAAEAGTFLHENPV